MYQKKPFGTGRKRKGVRLSFTLVSTLIKELNTKQKPEHTPDLKKFTIAPVLSSKFHTLLKAQNACAKQDLHLLHFRLSFCRHKVPFRDFFDWKIDKMIRSRPCFQRSGFLFSRSIVDLLRSRSIKFIPKTVIHKEFNDLFIHYLSC